MAKWHFVLVQIHCFLFSGFVLATLQNITVDDAVLTGAVVPQYLPTQVASAWNTGNDCSGCLVQPNASQAHNGTWHDATYSASNSYTQTIQFTFTGSALYIFFILANTVPFATTFTYVSFNLDGTLGPTFRHNASTSTAYEYNQAVYANDSLTYGQHTMTIEPVNSGSNVLMLFDYLIYTVDTETTTSSSTGKTITTAGGQVFTTIAISATSSATQTSSGSPGTASRSDLGAIVGGSVAGGVVLVLAAAYILCYRPYKRRAGGQSNSAGATTVEPFVISPQISPTSFSRPSRPMFQMLGESPLIALTSQSKRGASPAIMQSSVTPSSNPASSSASDALSGSAAEIIAQVGLLRDEVARLRELQTQSRNPSELELEAPPEYHRLG